MLINLFQLIDKQTLDLGMAEIQAAPYQILATLGHQQQDTACLQASTCWALSHTRKSKESQKHLVDPQRERKLQKFSIQWEGRGELQHARLDMTLQKSRKLFLTFVFYCTPAVI